ncbi:hypothetical protein OSTOST_13526 [Ostertagia ostertagi]
MVQQGQSNGLDKGVNGLGTAGQQYLSQWQNPQGGVPSLLHVLTRTIGVPIPNWSG